MPKQKLPKDSKKVKEDVIQNFLNKQVDQSLLKEILIQLVIRSLKKPQTGKVKLIVNSNEPGKIDEKLEKADDKIAEVLGKAKTDQSDEQVEQVKLDDLDDLDLATIKKLEEKGVRIIYPNLKYRKPKYKNVESILNYVESEGGSGEIIKLVIMNFND